MFKVSFKGNFKEVQTFNNKETVVTLTGYMALPDFMESCFPNSVQEWVNNHPSVKVSKRHCWIIEVQGKSTCADGDVYDYVQGSRIAESRAKLRLYKFMHTLCKNLMCYYYGVMYGVPENNGKYLTSSILSEYNGGLKETLSKYFTLWNKEATHLNKLLDKK